MNFHKKAILDNVFKLFFLSLLILFIPVYLVIVTHHTLPIGDEWDDNIILYFNLLRHHLQLKNFLALHNEHRLFLTRVFYWISYSYFPKEKWFVNVISYFFILASFILIIIKLENTKKAFSWPANISKSIWTWIFIASIIFSLNNRVIYAWGYLIQFPLTLFFFLTAIFILDKETISFFRLLACIFFSILTTLSSANGINVWIICFLMLLVLKVEKSKLWFFGVTSLATIVLYYHKEMDQHLILFKPITSLHYFFLFFSNIIITLPKLNLAIGLIVFGLYLLSIYFSFSKLTRKNITYILPWLALGLFSIANAAEGSFARIFLTANEALSERYSLFAGTLYISIFISYLMLSDKLNKTINLFLRFLLFAFIILSLSSFHIKGKMILNEFYKLPSEIALPYKVFLDNETDLYPYPSSNYKIFNRLKKYYYSQLYSLALPNPNFLGKKINYKESIMIGRNISKNNFVYYIVNQSTKFDKIHLNYTPFEKGKAIIGHIVSAKNKAREKFSNDLLFLDKNHHVIGIGYINENFFHFKIYKFFEGFLVKKTKIKRIIRLYKNKTRIT